MDTLRLNENDAQAAAKLLLQGHLVAIPTDTVYGLAAHPGIEQAVHQVYSVKSRPLDKALLLLVSGTEAMERYCRATPDAYRLAYTFWPGALTIVLPKRDTVSDAVTSGMDTVGIRCPNNELARQIIRLAGGAVAAPSANISGWDAPTCAASVYDQLDGSISAVVDGGACPVGEASTIVTLTDGKPVILRQGTVTETQINAALDENSPRFIGITGPTGSGKSTALSVLTEMGALVLDCDRIYHEMLESDGELLNAIADLFPTCIVQGRLDRKALGKVVFADKEALNRLNDIVDARIDQRLDGLIADYVRKGGKLVAIDAIRILEGNLKNRCDCVVGIVADKETRKKRIIQREGISEEYAQSRISAQQDTPYYKEHCDYTIENDYPDTESFQAACRQQFDRILKDLRRK